MTPSGLSALRLAYKKATDDWVNAIRAEETLATPDHSMTAMELWDEARPKRETPTKTHFETLTTGYDRLHSSARSAFYFSRRNEQG